MKEKEENKQKMFKGLNPKFNKFPKHVVDLALLMLNNAEIKRFTALGIINYLKQTKRIDQDAKVYVKFSINKYAISINGLKTEYSYNDSVFISALLAAFTSFASHAEKVIRTFVSTEKHETLEDMDMPDPKQLVVNPEEQIEEQTNEQTNEQAEKSKPAE